MAIKNEVTLALPTLDNNGVSVSQTPAAGGEQFLLINGADATISEGIPVSIIGTGVVVRATSDATETGTATITGELGGVVVSEVLTLPDTTFVDTTQKFDVVTDISLSANSVGNVKFGTAAADNGFVTAAALSAGSQTFDGAYKSGYVEYKVSAEWDPRRLGITSTGNDSARTFTVTGDNRHGIEVTDAITGANAGEAVSVLDLRKVTRIKVDADTAAAVIVGNTDERASQWFQIDNNMNQINIGITVALKGSPTVNYDIEFTSESLSEADDAITIFNHDTLVSETTSQYGNIVHPATGFRLRINSYTASATATVVMTAIQSGKK